MSNKAPDEQMIPLVQRLAALLDTEDGARILALQQKLRLFSTPRPSAQPAAVAPTSPGRRIGIWEADGQGGFVRASDTSREWRCWADVSRIPPRGKARRVVFLGESVARGYFYDPVLTPAMVLERMLAAGGKGEAFEVIDLARIDITPRGLAPLFQALPALQPDAIVLFAGNNWHTTESLTPAHLEMFQQVLPSGYPVVRKLFTESVLPDVAQRTIRALADAARACGDAATVVVVPEFNLRDWQPENTMLAALLPEGRNGAWLRELPRARRALAEGDIATAEAIARRLTALDEGTSAASQVLLGQCLLARGAVAEARAAFEAARDAPCGLPLGLSPRCPAPVQRAMRTTAEACGSAVVDLPRLFADRFGAIADRNAFLDYCHLTLAGIRTAISAVAESLLGRLVGASVSSRGLAEIALPISAEDEARAHLLAAVHNAHYGQPSEILQYHSRRALSASPAIAEDMRRFLDFPLRKAPRWMCRSFVDLCRSPAIERYLLSQEPHEDDKFADFELCEAIATALEEAGVPGKSMLAQVLAEEHGRAQGVDLLAPCYSMPHKWAHNGYERQRRPIYHRGYDLRSTFYLPREAPGALRLSLTCRIPSGAVEPKITISVNERVLSEYAASTSWQTVTVEVPSDLVRAGVNRIEVHWPPSQPSWDDYCRAAAASLDRAAPVDALLVLGEIHAFEASVAAPP